ncbi:MAG: hypothetical protein IJE43_07050 [Alphaproteobacteria bacterium]|nr:hypothetical protein [Alphaproteobacteria bacterium]MBQ6709623.1 hypothetical protein [Bacteroidales bacterium]
MIQHEIWNIIQSKIGNEALKNFIRCTYSPEIADLLCRAIDAKEHADLFEKLYKEWLEYQKRQSDIIQAYLKTMGM